MLHIPRPIANRVLREYLQAYRDAIAAGEDLDGARRQLAPYASLGEGAAGTAYALWRIGERQHASAWVKAALADRRRSAFAASLSESSRRVSTMFGRAGVRWVSALVEGREHVNAYSRILEAGCPRVEFASGAAGHLLAALILLRQRPTQRLDQAAAQLADRLNRAVRRRARRGWCIRDATGFAHGWPGVLYAILQWHGAKGTTPDGRVLDAVRDLAAIWSAQALAHPMLQASWCNGAAGATLLWAATYALTRERRFLRVGRRAARAALASSGRASTLCCGDAGVAYALLAMARVDEGTAWRERANAVCVRAIRCAEMPRPFGLFQGHAGLVCLAHDCLGRPRGFPAVDA
jgi:serine/threonine-protein kinase